MKNSGWIWGVLAGWLLGVWFGGGGSAFLTALIGGLGTALWLRVRTLEQQVAVMLTREKLSRAPLDAPQAVQPVVQPEEPSVVPQEMPSSAPVRSSDAGLVFDVSLPPEQEPDRSVAPPPSQGRLETLPEWRWPAWASRLLEGNPLAKIGVVLLFFGVASAFRLAVEYGWLPVPVRLGGAALAGGALILFGWNRYRAALTDVAVDARLHFAWAIQGGGFALLYLVVYFMLARYALLSHTVSFALFALLGAACVLLAARQNGAWLAIFGLAGAFLAPVLAGGQSPTPLPLFLYLALINLMVLAVDWVRAWRVLNVAGFLLTLAVSVLWAWRGYHEGHYLVTQGFLVFFVVIYSAMPVVTLLRRAPGAAAWQEGVLIFGVPLSGIALQSRLLAGQHDQLALSALGAAAYYLALWAALYRRSDLRAQVFERAQIGIAIAFLTLAVPLAFDAQVTSAFWAAEGCAVLWFGLRSARRLAQWTGLAMQLAAGVSFGLVYVDLARSRPILNDLFLGGLILSVAGLACARLLQSAAQAAVFRSQWVLIWAWLWWIGTGVAEAVGMAVPIHAATWALAWVAMVSVGAELLGQRWQWPPLRQLAAGLLAALWCAAAWQIDRHGHPLAGVLWLVFPMALLVHFVILVRQQREGEAEVWQAPVRHVGSAWLAVGVAGWELAWWGERSASGASLWSLLAWGVCFASALALNRLGLRRAWQPWASAPAIYAGPVALGIAALAALWALMAMGLHAGGGSGWVYIPILNPYDMVVLAVLASIWRSGEAAGDVADASEHSAVWKKTVGVLAFVWITTLAARIAHHFGGVPFRFIPLWDSTVVHALMTMFWTLSAIVAMIVATRWGRRQVWMGGMALLGGVGAKLLLVDLANAGTAVWTGSLIGVALLLLAAAYFAPSPPAAKAPAAL